MIKIGLLATMALLVALVTKKEHPELSVMIVLITGIIILMYGLSEVLYLKESLVRIMADIPMEGQFLPVLLKMLGISYCAEFVIELCKDNGYGSIAGAVDMFSRLLILAMGLPLVEYVIEMIGQYV